MIGRWRIERGRGRKRRIRKDNEMGIRSMKIREN